jgi:hypothetical protein
MKTLLDILWISLQQYCNTSHHIPIAEPNFPRRAVPFAIGMWVLGVCKVKTGTLKQEISDL